jgi:hypothetical protein
MMPTSIWAVARQTFAQCLRTKIGGIFIILLAIAMLVTPMLNSDQHVPLADRIRAFLSYSLGAATVLISVVTVFLSTGVVSSDVEGKQVFLLAVKPLARWQYILGRWLGVVMLDVILVGVSGLTVYLIAQHMRSQLAINSNDRRAVETELFSARRRIGPDMENIHKEVERQIDAKIEELKRQGGYDAAIQIFQPLAGGDVRRAEQLLREEDRKQIMGKYQSAAPRKSLTWIFKDIDVAGNAVAGEGAVMAIDRNRGLMEVEAPSDMLGMLLADRPVNVNGVDGRVVRIGPNYFDAKFPLREMTNGSLAKVALQSKVAVRLDPVLQITYKPASLKSTNGQPLQSLWFVQTPQPEDPHKPPKYIYREMIERQDPTSLPATLTVTSRLVDPDGRLEVVYLNEPTPALATTVSIRETDISVLYRVGSFEGNFLRGLVMIMVQLMFIAALGTFAGSFLGFAVASLLVFVLLPFGLAQTWLQTAAGSMEPGVIAWFSQVVMFIGSLLVADLEKLSPASSLVGGLIISWDFAGLRVALYALAGTGALLGLACAIFHKRELAKVQA